jgi:hypothetical protein
MWKNVVKSLWTEGVTTTLLVSQKLVKLSHYRPGQVLRVPEG